MSNSWRTYQPMQFYSDESTSDESSGMDDDDFWNPNELIEELEKATTLEQKLTIKRELLEKFLDQKKPILTPKMREFLSSAGIMESLLDFVTQVDDKKPADAISEIPTVRPPITDETEQQVKRSFNVTELFVNPSDEIDNLLDTKLGVVLKELFKIFQSNSQGNFYHFEKIMEQLLARSPVETTRTLLSENLFWQMLSFLHEHAVVDTVLSIFCCEFPKQSDTIQFYKSLVEQKVFDKIGEKVYTPWGKSRALYVAEFFVKLIEKLASFEMSGILFIGLCRSPNFINNMFKVIINEQGNFSLEQQKAAATILRELLLKSGEKMFDQSDLRPIPNMLSAVHDKLHEYSKQHMGPLCNVLLTIDGQKWEGSGVKFSSYTVKKPFGLFKFTLVEILSDVVVAAPECLDAFPASIWRVLSNWFIEYNNNNMYQCLFYRIVETAVRNDHQASLKNLLTKHKFLSKILEHYKAYPKSCARGFILNICNIFRLAAELQPIDGYLKHYLASHDAYQQFLPTLRADTQIQLKKYGDLDALDEEEEDESTGIDLGSAYARSLGYDEDAPSSPATPTAKKGKKKKKRSPSSLSSSQESPSLSSSQEVPEFEKPSTPVAAAESPKPPPPTTPRPSEKGVDSPVPKKSISKAAATPASSEAKNTPSPAKESSGKVANPQVKEIEKQASSSPKSPKKNKKAKAKAKKKQEQQILSPLASDGLKPNLPDPDADSDPTDSEAPWWQSIKSEFSTEDKGRHDVNESVLAEIQSEIRQKA